MDLEMFRQLYEYTRWGNRTLLDQVAALPPGEAEREIGTQFSVPTLKGMLAHILGAEAIWLRRWQGESPTSILSGKDFPDLTTLRARWNEQDAEMEAFLGSLTEVDLAREIHYRNTEGKPFHLPLWALLQHVANHSTHHRSEVATMLTMVKASPPDSGVHTYHLVTSGQMS